MVPTQTQKPARMYWDSPFDLATHDFDGVLRRWFSDLEHQPTASFPVDIHEDENGVHVEAELPGFTNEQVNVTFENQVLSIIAERKPPQKKGDTHLTERRYTKVARSFTLPKTVDGQNIDARLNAGVLQLTLPKREEVKPRKIKIR